MNKGEKWIIALSLDILIAAAIYHACYNLRNIADHGAIEMKYSSLLVLIVLPNQILQCLPGVAGSREIIVYFPGSFIIFILIIIYGGYNFLSNPTGRVRAWCEWIIEGGFCQCSPHQNKGATVYGI